MEHAEIILAFDDIRNAVQDLNVPYARTMPYVGVDTVRLTFKDIEKTTPEDLVRHLNRRFPEYTVIVGREPKSVLVFIKGPGKRSVYK